MKKPHFMLPSGTISCGRQLSARKSPEGSPITDQHGLQATSIPTEVKCRWCLRTMGLLSKLTRQQRDAEGEIQHPDYAQEQMEFSDEQ